MAKNGVQQKVYMVATNDNANSYTAIAGEKSSNINIGSNLIDTSDKNDEWDACMAGPKNWEVSIDFNLDNSATAKQKEFLTSLIAGTPVNLFIGELSTGTPTEGLAGSGFVSAVSETRNRGEVISRSVTVKGNGALTPTFPA